MKRTGAQIVWEMLRHEGVDVVFGMPGGGIMVTYHPLQEYGIRHVLVRHEQAAAHAADGYARVTGRVGVAIATSGPGATNLTTGIATAMMDSVPLVCITGQVCTSLIGSDAFQEADITGITLPITKHNYLVTDVDDLADVLHEAFYIAGTGRPGPVLVDLPADVQRATTSFTLPDREPNLGGYRPTLELDLRTIERASDLINRADRPVLLAGHGIVQSGAANRLLELAQRAQIPVTTTLLGKCAFPRHHPLSMGMMGMHGSAVANQAIQRADLLVAVGMRFDDRVTGCLEQYAPDALKLHIDHDLAEIGKNVAVDLAVHGDVRDALDALLPRVHPVERPAFLAQIEGWRQDEREHDLLSRPEPDRLVAPRIIHAIAEATHGAAIVVTDVGQNQMWAAQYYDSSTDSAFVTSGGLGTMGYGVPAAIGAQIAKPDAEVWAIAGDGGFQMNLQELGTLIQEGLPIRLAVLNNGFLGMVRQWQEMFFDGRYESTRLVNPDFVLLASAYGIPAWRAETPDEARTAIAQARACDGPALIEFMTVGEGEEGNVYPMVPAGAALHEMIRRPIPAAVRMGGGDA